MDQESRYRLARHAVGDGELPSFLRRINWGAYFLPLPWSLVYRVPFWALLLVLLGGTVSGLHFYLALSQSAHMLVLVGIAAVDVCVNLGIRIGLARNANRAVWERYQRIRDTHEPKTSPALTISEYVTHQWYWAIAGVVSGLALAAYLAITFFAVARTPASRPFLYPLTVSVGVVLVGTVGLFILDRRLAATIQATHQPACRPERWSWSSLKISRRIRVLAGLIAVLFLYGQWAGGRFERPPSGAEITAVTKSIATEVPDEYAHQVTLESVEPVFGNVASASGAADVRELFLDLRRFKYAVVFRVNGTDARFTMIRPRHRKVYEADMVFFGMLEEGVAEVIEYYHTTTQAPPIDVYDSTFAVADPQPGARYWTITGYDSKAGDVGFEREPIVVLEQGEGHYKRIPDPPYKEF